MKLISLLLWLLFATLAHANPVEKVKSVVSKFYPEATMNKTNNTTHFSLNTMEFKIHGRQMTGQILDKTHIEIGPSHLGFIIKITHYETGVNQQAMVPQTLKEPYWNTYINKVNEESGNGQYLGSFSYGSRISHDFIKAVSLALSPPKVDQKPNKTVEKDANK